MAAWMSPARGSLVSLRQCLHVGQGWKRIDRRNAADIFTPSITIRFLRSSCSRHISSRFQRISKNPVNKQAGYKGDSTYMEYVYGKDYRNELPVSVTQKIASVLVSREAVSHRASERLPFNQRISRWRQLLNDYGIGLLLRGNAGSDKGELKQAAAATSEVEVSRPEDPSTLLESFKEGRVDDAAQAAEAAAFDPQPRAGRWPGSRGKPMPKEASGSSHHQLSEYSKTDTRTGRSRL